MTKPRGVAVRISGYVVVKYQRGHPGPLRHLFGTGPNPWCVRRADEYVVVLVFDEILPNGKVVPVLKGRREGGREAELLGQPATSTVDRGFPGTGMAAAGVRPEAAGVIFVLGSALEQKPAGRVEDKHRKGAVKPAFDVCLHLVGGPERLVILIYQYDRMGHIRLE